MEQFHRGLIDGTRHGPGAGVLRTMLRVVEPFYAGATRARNAMFSRGYTASTRAARPVVSVGNITTGGTGKTPVVRWLCQSLSHHGHRPAVLMRGYKAAAGEPGDEQRLLQSQLPDVIVHANPSRVRGAAEVVAVAPEVSVFVLDDGFQHRNLQRDFDLVLIDATNPFGFDHVLPRGLLREPLTGLSRASAILLTHTEAADAPAVEAIVARVGAIAPHAPVYRCSHQQTHLTDPHGTKILLESLRGRRTLSFCGIGNPSAFEQQLSHCGASLVATHRFGDHHAYSQDDFQMLIDKAKQAGAELLVTTGKDWVKLSALVAARTDVPTIVRMEMSIRFEAGDEEKLFQQIQNAIKAPRTNA